MADLVELAAEGVDRLVDSHHFDKGYDKGYDVYRKYVNGEKVESTVTPYDREKDGKRSRESNVGAQSNSKDTSEKRGSPRASQAGGASREVRSSAAGGAPPSGGPESHHPSNTTVTAAQTSSRRKQRNDLPSPERDNFASTAIPAAAVGVAAAGAYTYNNTQRNGEFERQSSISDQVLREYEREADDPTRRAEKVLSPSQLNKISRSSTVKSSNRGYRRDSAMTSRYADDYREAGSQYAGSNRPRSQPPRSRYDDDGDSDYDEKSGRRSRGTGRGYDDREYDRVIEETERYRGPVGAGPLVPFARRDSQSRYDDDRSHTQGPNTTVTRYRDSDRDGGDTYLTRRTSRRGRDSEYSSRSRSRSRSGGPRWKEKLEDTFDTSAQGLGVGLAGAVIGGLAGREFGGKNGGKNAQRDMAIGAIIGGLGANIAENKYREWREKKEDEKFDRREERWDSGRSRSNVR